MPRSKSDKGGGFRLKSCDPCGAFGGGETKIQEHDETDCNTTLSTNSPSRESQQSSKSRTREQLAENDVVAESSTASVEVEDEDATAFQTIRYLVRSATLCVLDAVCCHPTRDNNDDNSLLLSRCGRRCDGIRKQRRFRCTTVSWGPDDSEDISVLQDSIIEESEYDGGLRDLGGRKPVHSIAPEDSKHTNSFRKKYEKCCAYCGAKGEAKRRMKICSRCKSTHYCSKGCQYEDWYDTHMKTCVLAPK